MTETPPTKPPLPSLRDRLKLPQHVGERLVISATATAQCDEGEDDPLLEWMRSVGVSTTRALPPLRERLKLPDNCIDVTDQHKGEVFVLTNPGSVDGSSE